jgi:eukaryotic-like serine/threonine-protein kinase
MPDAIGHYKILGSLGIGGLGEVYRARDTALGRTVAVKVLPPAITGEPERLRGLLATVEQLRELSHPNIAMLFENSHEGEHRFLVFEFVQGQPLAALINGRALHVRRALEFGINLADALADAHAVELIHGDINPDNIMITPKDRAKFMNFGLSRFTAGGTSRVSAASPYVSPEELTGGTPDSRSDIYSLGAVMFEMLTGRRRARGLVLSGLNATVPEELEQLIGRMLAATVDHRAQSAATVAAELRSIAAILDTRTEAAEAAAGLEPMRRTEKRRNPMLAILVGLVVLAAALIAWLALGRV